MDLAIPINIAVPIIQDLEMTGTVQRPTMGVSLFNVEDVPSSERKRMLNLPDDIVEGVIVTQVFRNTPAQTAGVQQYDVIVEMDGEKISDMVGLAKTSIQREKSRRHDDDESVPRRKTD